MKFIVSQIGARRHYAVPRALHRQGLLAGLVTDWYAPRWMASGWMNAVLGGCFGRRGRAALAARTAEIPDRLVRAFRLRSLFWKWQVHQKMSRGRGYGAFLRTDAAFGRAAARFEPPPHEVFFGFAYASLEMLAAEKQRGVLTVLCQFDPGAVEFRLVAEEMARHPEVAGPPPAFPAAYYERNRREWKLADIIVVNSVLSREAIIFEGTDPAKIEVLPLAFEMEDGGQRTEDGGRRAEIRPPTAGTLRVLWFGRVNVRKGIYYLMEAARLLERENVHFDVVGPMEILPGPVVAAPQNMTFHGSVSRDRAAEWYRHSDVFVLPTLSDGFGLTQLEALAHGLPVIVTPNCGQVVQDGKTGFVIPPRNPQSLAQAILCFVRNPGLAREMAPACRETIKAYSIDAYGRRLVDMATNRRRKILRKRGPLVNLAVCGRFHYQNYVRHLETAGLLNQFFYADRISRGGKTLGIPAAKAVNGFFKEYAVHLHNRLLKSRWKIPAYGFYHDSWQRYVLTRWTRADILHVMLHGNARLLMGRAKEEGAIIIGEPVNCHPHELRDLLNEEHERLGLKQRAKRNVLDERIIEETGQSDRLLVASQWLKDSFVKAGFAGARMTVIPYGIDPNRFSPVGGPAAVMEMNQLKKDKFRVVCVGQITPRKGHAYLLEAWRQLKLANAELLFIGRIDPIMVTVLSRYQGCFKHITHVPNHLLQNYYGASNLFVLPSIEDGFGYVSLEAMACGLPAIITDHCGSSEIIHDGVTGFKVPIRSPETLAEKIELLYRDRDRLASMGQAARNKVVQEMGWENYACKLRDYYETIFRQPNDA